MRSSWACRLPVAMLLVLSVAPARADVAPQPIPFTYVPAPWPAVDLPHARHQQSPLVSPPTTRSGVTLVSAAIAVDLTPTFQRVHQALLVRGGATPQHGLVVGLPETIPVDGELVDGRPLEALEVRVDGRVVALRAIGGRLCVGDEERVDPSIPDTRRGAVELANLLAMGCDKPSPPGAPDAPAPRYVGHSQRNQWWLWTMDVPAATDVRIDIQYLQLLTGPPGVQHDAGGLEAAASYSLRPGAEWSGPIADATITLHLDGVDRAAVAVVGGPKPSLASDRELQWTLHDVEPSARETLGLTVTTPEARLPPFVAVAPYAVHAPRWLQLTDRLLRFFARRLPPSATDWSVLIESLRADAAQTGDPRAAVAARDALAAIADWYETGEVALPAWLHRDATQPRAAPAVDARTRRTLEWLTPTPAAPSVPSDPAAGAARDATRLDLLSVDDRWLDAARPSLGAASEQRSWRGFVPLGVASLAGLLVAVILALRFARRSRSAPARA